MERFRIKLRNVVTSVACLAATTVCSGCDPEDDPMNNGADIVTFTFNGIDGTAAIDKDALTVIATADETVDLTSIAATFTLSNGATATVNGVAQASGATANDFTNTVTYAVTSSDGNLINIWKVTITGGKSDYHFFGIKQGRVVYSYTWWNGSYLDEQTHILTFDNYGYLMRTETLYKNGDDWMRSVYIIDVLAGKEYFYGFEESLYPNNPYYSDEISGASDWMHTEYHCWKADSWQWGTGRKNLQIKANETIAEQSCSIFSFTEDDVQHEYAEWNNLTMWHRYSEFGNDYELRATSFSISIPDNSFKPYN
jgi:hypothetical protein